MPRTKEKRKIIHQPSTLEIFRCLSYTPMYSHLLLKHAADKPYLGFLNWLLDNTFFESFSEKITIKKLATEFKCSSSKVTKWIEEIYEDIFDLNYSSPDLFQSHLNKMCLIFKYFDNSCSFYLSLPFLPREYEIVNFPFVKAKIGVERFWVKRVEYLVDGNASSVDVWVEGESLNKYREFVLDKALFQEHIWFMDVFNKHSFELDDELKKLYKS